MRFPGGRQIVRLPGIFAELGGGETYMVCLSVAKVFQGFPDVFAFVPLELGRASINHDVISTAQSSQSVPW